MEFYSPSGHTVAYTTSSDYRLKTDVKAMTGALERIMRLKPDTYRWMADGSYGEGFLAHELQEVVGIAVTGEKDGTDGAGKPKYQSVDYGKLTPVLTAGIQELKGENDIQAEKIAELEAAILELRTRCGN
ncbi:MAG: hypothetical protein QG650_395 [Patescibacteria group bacterium]|nr:hypothetical protein [Patescibacteria group bacterium]